MYDGKQSDHPLPQPRLLIRVEEYFSSSQLSFSQILGITEAFTQGEPVTKCHVLNSPSPPLFRPFVCLLIHQYFGLQSLALVSWWSPFAPWVKCERQSAVRRFLLYIYYILHFNNNNILSVEANGESQQLNIWKLMFSYLFLLLTLYIR